ncbi:MAG: hypothetical protein COT73_08375 [Bdellovibrio sp. CG10_big_fil_rev_8_21_14_0_10_47_8]|nr:MAG: hypothetical protein COT73_08375 [Bdellovibrio sp. CG10_big_fil_rev_8_21_14_0_10_47_8]
MFFNSRCLRHFSALVFCASLLMAASGCNVPLNESIPETTPPDAGLNAQCFDESMPVLDQFFAGEAKAGQIVAMWDCLDATIATFEKATRGRYEDRFTARELANFVERYFMKQGKSISPKLLVELFRVKQLFVGGANSWITRQEMANTKEVFDGLKRICLDLNPYMKVYTLNWKASGFSNLEGDIKYFENANKVIQQAAKDLATLIGKNGQSYHLDNVITLVTELAKLSGKTWDWVGSIQQAMPLVQKLKRTLAGGSETDIEPFEWRRFALLGSRGYIQYLRYFYFLDQNTGPRHGPELVYITKSVDDLFSFLGDMVDGKAEKTLTRAELLEIIHALAQFIPSLEIKDELLIELMKIKVLLFGGNLDYFEKADFERARVKLEAFQNLTEKFLTYAEVYSMEWKPMGMSKADSLSYFRLAEDALGQIAQKLGENLESSYNLQDLQLLAAQLDELTHPKPSDPQHERLRQIAEQYVPSLIVLKNIFFTDQTPIIGIKDPSMAEPGRQWADLLTVTANAYSRYMYYAYFLKDQDWMHQTGLEHFSSLVQNSLDLVQSILKRKTTSNLTITFDEMHNLWTALVQAKLLPEKITVTTLDQLSHVLFEKWLLPYTKRLAGDVPRGFSSVAVEQIKSEFAIWFENQKFYDLVYQGVPEDQGRSPEALLKDLTIAAQTEGIKELRMIYSSPVALSYEVGGRLQFSRPPANYLIKTADMVNLVRSGLRLAIRSYAMDPLRIRSYQGLTEGEANQFFMDVFPVVVELEMLPPSSKTFMESRFRDANLFTPYANGDHQLDFWEGTHLAMMLLSGVEIHGRLYAETEKQCAVTKPTPYKDDWLVPLSCAAPVYKTKMFDAMASMPDFVNFMKTMAPAQFDQFFANMVKAAGYLPDNNSGLIKIGDLSQVPHVFQYVEMIFSLYDVDRDGFLSTEEAMKAYPTFKNILLDAAKGKLKSDKQLRALLGWLLKKGEAPDSMGDYVKFLLIWMNKGEKNWKVMADRERLATILGYIADATAADRRAQLKALLPDQPPEDIQPHPGLNDDDEN